uniref:Amino acid transporter n=1 Tax=Echeneis naucrates TaxID=173247 RepID=A0A665TRE1_ECHNA
MVCCSKLQTVASTDDYDTNTSPGTSETSYLDPLSKNRYDFKAFLWRNSFVLLTVAAVVIGFGLGFGLRFANMTDREIGFFTFPGELLMEMLQMLLLPLIVSSLITGISSIDMKACQKMGLHALCFYGVTTFMAVGTGIFVVSLIQPGKARNLISVSPVGQVKAMHTVDSFLDLMRNMFPPNLVIACFRTVTHFPLPFTQYKTVYSQSGVGNQTSEYDTVPMPGTAEGMNVLGLAVFCIAFGLILSHMENEAKPLKDFFSCLNKANMHLIWIVIW